jgi:alcohol dehydrogenase class IV
VKVELTPVANPQTVITDANIIASMLPDLELFEFEHSDCQILYGRGVVDQLETRLEERGFESAVLVCGSNVGANETLMDPVLDGIGDLTVTVFDETTPEKTASTLYDAIDLINDRNPDVLIGLGGGSSLDIARQTCVFDSDGRSLAELRESAMKGTLEPHEANDMTTPVIVVPTTFAGACLSGYGSIEILAPEESPSGQPVRLMGPHMPILAVYDPNLFETTPVNVLTNSLINGFDKGIEAMYAPDANPVSLATAGQGIELFSTASEGLRDGEPAAMNRAVNGLILCQVERRMSVIHSFAHGFARRYSLQQGRVHAVFAPYILEYIFDRINGRRQFLAESLGLPAELGSAATADAIIAEVGQIRDNFGLPSRLREIDVIERRDFHALAESISGDSLMAGAPEGINFSVEVIKGILEDTW